MTIIWDEGIQAESKKLDNLYIGWQVYMMLEKSQKPCQETDIVITS